MLFDITGDACPANYVPHPTNQFCYWAMASGAHEKSFNDAETECQNLVTGRAGSLGHLAKITDADLHNWILENVIRPVNANL